MFEDNNAKQPNTPAIPKDPPVAAPSNDVPTTPNTVPAPEVPSAPQKEPEDIFSSADPLKKDSPEAPSEAPQTAVPAPAPAQSAPTDEQSLKTGPSPFVKKEEASLDAVSPEATVDTVIPEIPKSGMNKKNLAVFIILIIFVVGAVAAMVWWFTSRPDDNDINPAVIDLFNDTDNTATDDNTNNDNEAPDDKNGSSEPDADGDGLSDEEEATLGTSINSPDTDNDGLYDKEEVKTYLTDPLKSDTDGDGWNDGEEVRINQDPLTVNAPPDPENTYLSNQFKFKFIYPDQMVLESVENSTVQFNDNFNQIKLYIYLGGTKEKLPIPDISYAIDEKSSGELIIKGSQENEDSTPYSTEFFTNNYNSNNGRTYSIRYVATKKADDHKENFEEILNNFKFLR
jgi:hypothetical protein